MKITHKLDEFLSKLFPDILPGTMSHEQIAAHLKQLYAYGPFTPTVKIEGDTVTIDMPVENPKDELKEYERLVNLCDQGKFDIAKERLKELLDRSPGVSDYWRIKGQIAEVEQRYDDAINDLINALKWDPGNVQALIMMGNVYARHLKDVSTALTFLNKAVELSPNDPYALNNIGGILLQENKFREAMPYFEQAITLKPSFVNPYHGLGICAESMGDFLKAFTHYHKALLLPNVDTVMKERSLAAISRIVDKMAASNFLEIELSQYSSYLERFSGKPIRMVENADLEVFAKILIAEVYNKPHHTLKFRKASSHISHLMMHELVHLEFIIQARQANVNRLFMASDRERTLFNSNLDNYLRKAKTKLTPESLSDKLRRILFDGLNSQIYNTPIDLFIEQLLFDRFPSLRPMQFVSLNEVVNLGVQAATNPNILSIFPAPLVSKSRILNMVLALQYKDLFGIDKLPEFKATPQELTQATMLYNEYLEYKDDRKP